MCHCALFVGASGPWMLSKQAINLAASPSFDVVGKGVCVLNAHVWVSVPRPRVYRTQRMTSTFLLRHCHSLEIESVIESGVQLAASKSQGSFCVSLARGWVTGALFPPPPMGVGI